MRAATVRAARRRGWVWPIRPRTPRPSSRQSLGSWVLFPEPVSPATITTWLSRMAASTSSRRSTMGSSAGYAGVGTSARRLATTASAAAMSRATSASACARLPVSFWLPGSRRSPGWRRPASRRSPGSRRLASRRSPGSFRSPRSFGSPRPFPFAGSLRTALLPRSPRLLARDAAHVHPPQGGQGLNIGVQDAVNLGWKLAQVIDKTSPDSLLDTYHAERHPVGAMVLHSTMAQVALSRPDERHQALRDTVRELLAMDEPRKRFAAMISGLDTHYEHGD